MRWLDSTTDSTDMNLSNLQDIVEDRGALHAAANGVAKIQTHLSDWTRKTTEVLSAKCMLFLTTPCFCFWLFRSGIFIN